MEVIAIATDAAPTKSLGGPGKFAPSLFESLLLAPKKKHDFIGLFRGQLARNRSEIRYSDTAKIAGPRFSLREKLAIYAPQHFIKASKIKRSILSPERVRTLQKHNIGVVHAHDFSAVDRLKDFPGKIILTNHYKGSLYKEAQKYQPGMSHPAWEYRYLEMERSAIQRADLITFPSLSAKILLTEDYPILKLEIERKSTVIYSGIDPHFIDTVRCKELDNHVYLNVANHIPDKGIDIALQVFGELRRHDPEALFINIGLEGPETDHLKKLSKSLGIQSSTKFLGVCQFSEVIALMKSSFALIHTPRRVVFDLTVLEAMAAGLPIIASSVIGNIEALGDTHPLLLNAQSASIDDMACLLEDNASRDKIIRNQRARLEKEFTVTAMVHRYLSLYDGLN